MTPENIKKFHKNVLANRKVKLQKIFDTKDVKADENYIHHNIPKLNRQLTG